MPRGIGHKINEALGTDLEFEPMCHGAGPGRLADLGARRLRIPGGVRPTDGKWIMRVLAAIGGVALILVVLWDAFEAIVLPRRVTRRLRLARVFYRSTWIPWSAVARWMRPGNRREAFLSFYGPLSLIMLISVWAVGLVLGFASLQWGLHASLKAPEGTATLLTYLYMSGTSLFTLGLGDVIPQTGVARTLTVAEAGTGFAFLAMVMGYLPVLYQSFSRREVNISLLDTRAGSPPTAAELLRRHGEGQALADLPQFLREWERWSAELLESHLSFPVLAYYRSQHNNQSWLAALTTILDASALIIVGVERAPRRHAHLAFAMARHAVADLALMFREGPRRPAHERLPPEDLSRLRQTLAAVGVKLRDGEAADRRLAALRDMYEPYVNSLAEHLCMDLPPWIVAGDAADHWQRTAWGRIAGSEPLPGVEPYTDDHF
jgi:hypothetical protein